MSRMIFVNLPVTDLERSKALLRGDRLRNEPKFSNDAAAMMVLSDTISVMLLTHPFYATFTRKPIADANNSSQVLLCISCDSPADVDRITDAAPRPAERPMSRPKQDYGRRDVRTQLRGSRRPPLGADVDGPSLRRTRAPTRSNRHRCVTLQD